MISTRDNHNGGSNDTDSVSTDILQLLGDSSFWSLGELTEQVNVDSELVLESIKQLQKLGVDIVNQDNNRFKLTQQLNLLNKDTILSHIVSNYKANILVKNIVSSTNDVLRDKLESLDQDSVCVAEAQTHGRGRRGKKWVSPFGASVCLSMLWRFYKGYQSLEGLSLLIGMAVNQALKEVGIKDCKLKWPNDIYHNHKKLAGILIEVEGQATELTQAVIGIGVNFKLPNDIPDIDQAFTDVSSILNVELDRNLFVAKLLEQIWKMIPIFNTHGLKPFIQLWQSADLYHNKPVSLLLGKGVVYGIYRGINERGALLLQTEKGIETFHGGEVSVRPV